MAKNQVNVISQGGPSYVVARSNAARVIRLCRKARTGRYDRKARRFVVVESWGERQYYLGELPA